MPCFTAKQLTLIVALFTFISPVQILAVDYHVATNGNDTTGDGSLTNPWGTIQQAINRLKAGDTLLIREGTYHEQIVVNYLDGTNSAPVTIAAYANETVILDGTRSLMDLSGNTWTQHSGNIYRISLSADVWQLFVEGEMMIPARWPNAFLHDHSIWDREANWAKGLDGPSENGTMVDGANNSHNLAASGLDVSGAMAILNVGNWKASTRVVKAHASGSDTFSYDPVDFVYKDKNLYYYLEAKLDLLDAEREWFYDVNKGELYLWTPGGGTPGPEVRGKVQTYAFDFNHSDNIVLDSLNFFATTFRFTGCRSVTVKNCDLTFPSASKRMLLSTLGPDVTEIQQSNENDPSGCSLINCTISNTDSHAILMSGDGNRIENCEFSNIDLSVSEIPGLMVSIYMQGSGNVFSRNTVFRTGASSTLSLGYGPEVTLNDISDTGNLQSDGSITQLTIPAQPGTRVHHNWFHDTIKSGARFDATVPPKALGSDGTMDHNVVWNCNRGLMVKGVRHYVYHNTVFDSEGKDIIVSDENIPGNPVAGNNQSITRNNVADWLTGRRTRSTHLPVPGTADHNWNGYTTGTEVEDQLVDPEVCDFRPRAESDLVDAGVPVTGITDGYAGMSPDIGAYEAGATEYWIPGRQLLKASHPIPPDGAKEQPVDRDLIWLTGYQGTSSNLYFGTDGSAVANAIPSSPEFQGNQTNNIFIPFEVEVNRTYYWRIDTVTTEETVVGDVWSFTTDELRGSH